MNMGGLKMGGMSSDVKYMSYGGPVQHMFLGGLVKKAGSVLAKTPQARLLKFAVDQLKKMPVPPPLAKLANLKRQMEIKVAPSSGGGVNQIDKKDDIPQFNVIAPGGKAKEQTLGIRR